MQTALLQKYDIPAPRYTSYPTVPHWASPPPTEAQWLDAARSALAENDEISLYLHLPFCENLCTYCACNKRITKNHEVEQPYLESLLTEWRIYQKALGRPVRIKTLHLGGGTPTFFSPENLAYLLSQILSETEQAQRPEFSFEAHPSNTTREHLETLYGLGFQRISIGVQDFDNDILRLINRRQTAAQVKEVTTAARDIGYESINYDLIFGLPRQTPRHIVKTLKEVKNLRPDRIAFYSYAHVPWKSKSQRAYSEADLPTGSEKRKLYELGKRLLEKLDYHEVGMDHFALQSDELYRAARTGKLHRNFMGYTDRYTRLMIGLGASSISDSWTAFVQNEKGVEAYQASLAAGKLPIIKGHLLSETDKLLRNHILNLSCRYVTTAGTRESQHPAWQRSLKRLAPLVKDGLVRIQDYRTVIVTDRGRPFIRIICMAFDDYIEQRPNLAQPQFSQAV
ncbi:MAG: oxygen-independent coproporphyrinogen III oxidase [Bacteroidetes bacterium]|nr:MAG: oxygen-independent coproporphyrinogen III oxidase [Bacteroidota bacterium]